MKKIILSTVLSATLLGSAHAAGYYGSADPNYSNGGSGAYQYAYAQQECYQEPGAGLGFFKDNWGLMAGAAVGALLGNQIGHGSGRTLATVGGGVLGAWGGHYLKNRYYPTQPNQTVCP